MNETDLADLKTCSEQKKPYLSDVIKPVFLIRGIVNLIVAPCHSGKTTAANKILTESGAMSPRGLLLIDTTAGRDALLKHEMAQRTPAELAELFNVYTRAADAVGDRFITMTYYEFGCYARIYPKPLDSFDVIICDEIHNLIKYLAIEDGQNRRNFPEGIIEGLDYLDLEYASAFDYLLSRTSKNEAHPPLVVMMTATPERLRTKFRERNVRYILHDYTDKVRCDKTENIHHYANLGALLQKLNTRTLIYVPTIKCIQEFSEKADDGKRRIMSLWSMHNKKYPMSKEQLAVRDEILNNGYIPADIDMLFINAAYETSINIRNEDFQTIVIHNSNKDVQIQARGRLRHDIKDMYVYDSTYTYIEEYFPKEYLDVPLSANDREMIARDMALTNAKGRPLKWSSIATILKNKGCEIEASRINNQRYYTVRPGFI